MKNIIKYIVMMLSIVAIFSLILISTACRVNKHNVIHPVEIHDTLIIEDTQKIDSINIELNKIKQEKDSIEFQLNKTQEELFISNYKLERIREYNRIAAQGNNINFLRGWINRVLND